MKITPREKRPHAAGREKSFTFLIFLSPRRVLPFLAWGDFNFTRNRVSLALLSLRKNGGLLVIV